MASKPLLMLFGPTLRRMGPKAGYHHNTFATQVLHERLSQAWDTKHNELDLLLHP